MYVIKYSTLLAFQNVNLGPCIAQSTVWKSQRDKHLPNGKEYVYSMEFRTGVSRIIVNILPLLLFIQ